jgi:hypothetical protein
MAESGHAKPTSGVVLTVNGGTVKTDLALGSRSRATAASSRAARRASSSLARLDDAETQLIARTERRRPPERGERVAVLPLAGEADVFDSATGERLGA